MLNYLILIINIFYKNITESEYYDSFKDIYKIYNSNFRNKLKELDTNISF